MTVSPTSVVGTLESCTGRLENLLDAPLHLLANNLTRDRKAQPAFLFCLLTPKPSEPYSAAGGVSLHLDGNSI